MSHVTLVGKTLVFTLSVRARVQVVLTRASRNVIRVALNGRKGQNRYSLRPRHLSHGRYTLTVRAGSRTVRLKLTV